MPKFRKKPVVIEAFRITEETRRDNRNWPAWLHEAWNKDMAEESSLFPVSGLSSDGTDPLVIHTLEGDHDVSWGDWIIQGIKFELYPCKPDIFEATYEPVEGRPADPECVYCPNCHYMVSRTALKAARADFVCAGCGKKKWSEFTSIPISSK